ncbi:MAG: hypothetical protein OXF94_06265 [Gammaproteobacteria bacterium]|nr:hypothetical protein [Gammaproteobacteria bacterium]
MVKHYGDMELGRKDEEGVRAFYRQIPAEGGRKNTIPIRGGVVPRLKALKELEFSEIKFERWLKILSEYGLIGTYKRGIYRACRQDKKKNEVAYYKPIMRELGLYWAEQPGREYHLRQRFLRVLDTHHRGAAKDGQWTRPDLTLIGGKVLPYLPGKFLDVITFEVKLGMPLDGLYEALAHRRRANFAYVVCVCPKPWPEWDYATPPSEENQAALVAEATRQGIGVILVRQEDDFGLWSELVKPVRHEPDPQHIHDFLQTQCDREDCLKKLREWLDRHPSELPPVSDTDVRRCPLTTEGLEVALEMRETINKDNKKKGAASPHGFMADADYFDGIRSQLVSGAD